MEGDTGGMPLSNGTYAEGGTERNRERGQPVGRKRASADSDVPQQQHRPFLPHGPGQDVAAVHMHSQGMADMQGLAGQNYGMGQSLYMQQLAQAGNGGLFALPHNYAGSGRLGGTGMQLIHGGGGMPMGYSDAAQKQQPPKPAQRASTTHPSSKTYSELYARLPTAGGEAGLISEFLRDELRSLLKANRVSYHKGGPQNLMKSKAEMAADLMQLIQEGKLQENPAPITEEEANRSHSSRGKKKKKEPAEMLVPAAGTMAAPAPRMRSPVKWARQSPMSPSPPPPLTPRTRAAAEIILTFPPTTPRSRQRIMEATMADEDK